MKMGCARGNAGAKRGRGTWRYARILRARSSRIGISGAPSAGGRGASTGAIKISAAHASPMGAGESKRGLGTAGLADQHELTELGRHRLATARTSVDDARKGNHAVILSKTHGEWRNVRSVVGKQPEGGHARADIRHAESRSWGRTLLANSSIEWRVRSPSSNAGMRSKMPAPSWRRIRSAAPARWRDCRA